MAKLALFPILLGAGCVISGLSGALHDQISYTVSSDYLVSRERGMRATEVERHRIH